MIDRDAVRHTFVVGLRNAHAMEHQALSLMDRQIEHLAHYVEVETRLRSHRGETELQIERLRSILQGLGEGPSTLKDLTLELGANLQALAHMMAPDEIIKNCLANYAFENFEAASYRALLVMADAGGFTDAIPLLEQSLREEEAMVAFVEQTLPQVVRRYLALRASGDEASH